MLTLGPFAFSPRAVPTLAMVLFVALTLSLSRWQAHRAEYKRGLQERMEERLAEPPLVLTGNVPDAAPLLFRHVQLSGEWVAAGQIYVDNRVRGETAGFEVITPLRLRGTDEEVLVNRGWIERTADYPRAPRVPVPAGAVEVTGVATVPPARYLELSGDTVTGDVWQNLSLERYARAMHVALLPVVVLADTPAPGLSAVREAPDTGIARHVEYEFTWLAFALTAFALWIGLNVRRAR